MKKFAYLFSILMIGSLLFWTACEDDDEPGDLKPGLNFKGAAGYISEDATLNTNEPFLVGLNATANANSGAKLALLEITRTFNNAVWFEWDTAIDVAFYNIDINLQAINVVGTERISFKVTDKDGQSSEIAINITTEMAAGPINSYVQKILGAQHSITGSSFASADGTIYQMADAMLNSEKIDWVYYYGDTDNQTIAAPDDEHAKQVFTLLNDANWTTHNPTRFNKLDAGTITWDNIADDTQIIALTSSGVDKSRITKKDNNLAAGDILGFITASNKRGLIRVDAINIGSNGKEGTIELSVKVQQ